MAGDVGSAKDRILEHYAINVYGECSVCFIALQMCLFLYIAGQGGLARSMLELLLLFLHHRITHSYPAQDNHAHHICLALRN